MRHQQSANPPSTILYASIPSGRPLSDLPEDNPRAVREMSALMPMEKCCGTGRQSGRCRATRDWRNWKWAMCSSRNFVQPAAGRSYGTRELPDVVHHVEAVRPASVVVGDRLGAVAVHVVRSDEQRLP